MIHRIQNDNEQRIRRFDNYKLSQVSGNHENKYFPKFKYKLVAVISHIGELDIGHYVCFVKYR